MSPDQEKEPLMFEDLDQTALSRILDEQRKIVEACRKQGLRPPQCLICLDDLADSGTLGKRRGGEDGS